MKPRTTNDRSRRACLAALTLGLALGPVGAALAQDAPVVPLYRTDLPAPATLHYQLKRGWMSGNGELRWAPAQGRYELSLQGGVGSLRLLSQTSTGTLDAHGLAPRQFSDQRARGAAQVASFQPERGVITFSGQPDEVAWVPGTQDRLSWMVQLPAVVRADPQREAMDKTIELHVAGARGDADVWTFRFAGREAVRSEAGAVTASKWVREPRKPHDTAVEVWLDPARQHLPVRARLGGEGEALELLLQKSNSP